jgi:hypothetical protein
VMQVMPVVINVALIVIAIHAVMANVLLQALTIAAILPTFSELSLVPRDIAVICISIPAILVQILPVVIDVALVLVAVAPVLVEIMPVRLLICTFHARALRGCAARRKHACQCNSSKTMSDDGFDFHADPPYFDPGFLPTDVEHVMAQKVLADSYGVNSLTLWASKEHYGGNPFWGSYSPRLR